MPKDFSTSLMMIIIGVSLLALSNIPGLPQVFMWILLIASVVLNIIGIIGVVSYSGVIKKNN